MAYRYYSPNRPLDIGTYPYWNGGEDNRVIGTCNYEKRTYRPFLSRWVWGYVEYEKPLTKSEIAEYELVDEREEYAPYDSWEEMTRDRFWPDG